MGCLVQLRGSDAQRSLWGQRHGTGARPVDHLDGAAVCERKDLRATGGGQHLAQQIAFIYGPTEHLFTSLGGRDSLKRDRMPRSVRIDTE